MNKICQNFGLAVSVFSVSFFSFADNAPLSTEHNIHIGFKTTNAKKGIASKIVSNNMKDFSKLGEIISSAEGNDGLSSRISRINFGYSHLKPILGSDKFKGGFKATVGLGKGFFSDLKEETKAGWEACRDNISKVFNSVSPQDERKLVVYGNHLLFPNSGSYCSNSITALSWNLGFNGLLKYNITPKFYAALDIGLKVSSYRHSSVLKSLKPGLNWSINKAPTSSATAIMERLKSYSYEEENLKVADANVNLSLGYSFTKNLGLEVSIGYEHVLGVEGDFTGSIPEYYFEETELDKDISLAELSNDITNEKTDKLRTHADDIDFGGLTYGASLVYSF